MTRIKICGITNIDDARAAIDYGAHALGFVFVPNTPRYVGECAHFLEELRHLPPYIARVAVCTNAEAVPIAWLHEVDTIQFYAREWDGRKYPGKRWIQAFRIRDESSLEEMTTAMENAQPHALLLDAYHPGKLGGSGETFQWELACEAKARLAVPILLAGGLTPENVAEAIAIVRPYAVDVSSGVEAEPGHKDHAKLRAFIRAVQETDARLGY
jgi:phosphoribosylanthranilate isomerase